MNIGSEKNELYFRTNDRTKYVFIRIISEEEIEKINKNRTLPDNLTLVYSESKVKHLNSKYSNFYLVNKQPFSRGVKYLPDGYKLERKFNSKTAPIILVKE